MFDICARYVLPLPLLIFCCFYFVSFVLLLHSLHRCKQIFTQRLTTWLLICSMCTMKNIRERSHTPTYTPHTRKNNLKIHCCTDIVASTHTHTMASVTISFLSNSRHSPEHRYQFGDILTLQKFLANLTTFTIFKRDNFHNSRTCSSQTGHMVTLIHGIYQMKSEKPKYKP